MTIRQPDDELEAQLENALRNADSDRVKYHLREALQIQISDANSNELVEER